MLIFLLKQRYKYCFIFRGTLCNQKLDIKINYYLNQGILYNSSSNIIQSQLILGFINNETNDDVTITLYNAIYQVTTFKTAWQMKNLKEWITANRTAIIKKMLKQKP